MHNGHFVDYLLGTKIHAPAEWNGVMFGLSAILVLE